MEGQVSEVHTGVETESLFTPPAPPVDSVVPEILPPPPPPPPDPASTSALIPTSTVTTEEEEKEEAVSHDEFTDEESDAHAGNKASTPGRSVTLQMLLDAKILQPGDAAMTIEYLGQKFVGDLQADGKIKSHETETIFCSPSAWAIHCKRIINPDKKSGCGWASVKYKGKKLDSYKAAWMRKVQLQRDTSPTDDEVENEVEQQPALPPQRVVVKHNTVPNRMIQHDGNTLVEAVSFSSIGKVQPFLISIGTNACFVLDLHCHLTMTEVCGYLAGSWDVNTHNLAITHAFPCLTCKADEKPTVLVEAQIHLTMERMGLTLVGWYHSHPINAAMPTLRDCDSQLDYQIRKRGPSDLTYTPCVGIICSPYNPESPVLESSLTCYWVTPPPEQRPTEYPRPFLMQYTVVHDTHLQPHAMEQISKSIKYYATMIDDKAIKFLNQYKPDVTFLDKLKSTLAAKFPREQSDGLIWNFIKDALGCSTEGDDKLDLDALLAVSQPLPIPKSQPSIIPNIPSVSALQQMVNMPAGIPPLSIPSNAFGSLSGKYELPTHLNIPIPPSSSKASKNSSSVPNLGLPPGLDVLTSMTLGLGPNVSLGLPTSSYDALAANSLLANLPPGISTSLAATLTGTKLPDSLSSYPSLLSGRSSGLDKSGMMGSLSSTSSASASTSTLAASLASSVPSNLASNLMLSSAEIANALFQSGKFPSTSALLGLPDPMSQSILDANNMYLSPSLLKMQDTLSLLKPLSTSSPLMSKSEQNMYLKSTQDLMKSAKEYLPPDVNISALKSASKLDFSLSPDLSITKQPDVSISTISKMPKLSDYATDFTMPNPKSGESFLNQMLELTKKAGKADFSSDSSPSPSKIPKLDDYGSTLNLSTSSAMNLSSHSNISETIAQVAKGDFSSYMATDEPLNASSNNDNEPQNLSISTSNREKSITPVPDQTN